MMFRVAGFGWGIFLSLVLGLLPGCSPQALPMSEVTSLSAMIDDASIRQLQKYQANGELSAENLTSYYIDRINKTRDTVNAVIAISPQALEDAAKLDQVRKQVMMRRILQQTLSDQSKHSITTAVLPMPA